MKTRNTIKFGILLAGMATIATGSARAAALQPPDSDTLVAGYQLIQFNLKECMAITTGSGFVGNGSRIVSPNILNIAGKMCAESREFKPKLEALAKSKNFTLPDGLPTYLNARANALYINQNQNLGQQYLEDQISSHQDAVDIFQLEVQTGKDPDVKAGASEVLPIMQANLATLEKLRGTK